jgi:hypothetical protein
MEIGLKGGMEGGILLAPVIHSTAAFAALNILGTILR